MNDRKPIKIDVREIVRSKSPALARLSPLVNYLRRTVHEEEINSFLEKFSPLEPVEFVRATLRELHITYELVGIEDLDPRGRYIFASNHPFGGLDGLMLAERVSAHLGDVRLVVNDLLMNIDPLRDIFIPVNKHGRQNSEYQKLYNETFERDIPIITFPAGLCSRRRGGVVRDSEWKPSFIKQAIATKRDVVPVYFDGRLSAFFYRLSNFRKAIGLKANVEMLYLADEMFRQRGSHFHIVIGKPVSWESLNDGQRARHHAQRLRKVAYGLKKTE